ncbi:hypothetical protein ACVWY0_002549 [Arthrobacter sp. UYNi723]
MRGVLGWRSGLRNESWAGGHGGRWVRKTWIRVRNWAGGRGRGRIRGSWSRNSVWRERRGLALRRNGHDVSPQLMAAPDGDFRLLLCSWEEQTRLFFPIALNRAFPISKTGARNQGSQTASKGGGARWLAPENRVPTTRAYGRSRTVYCPQTMATQVPCPDGHGLQLGRRRVNVLRPSVHTPSRRRPLSFRAERGAAQAQFGPVCALQMMPRAPFRMDWCRRLLKVTVELQRYMT